MAFTEEKQPVIDDDGNENLDSGKTQPSGKQNSVHISLPVLIQL